MSERVNLAAMFLVVVLVAVIAVVLYNVVEPVTRLRLKNKKYLINSLANCWTYVATIPDHIYQMLIQSSLSSLELKIDGSIREIELIPHSRFLLTTITEGEVVQDKELWIRTDADATTSLTISTISERLI